MKHLKTKEVAEKLGFKPDYFRKEIKYSPEFPKPIQHKLASGGLSHPVWTEQQIEEYLKRIAA